jgi:hypothetical protein
MATNFRAHPATGENDFSGVSFIYWTRCNRSDVALRSTVFFARCFRAAMRSLRRKRCAAMVSRRIGNFRELSFGGMDVHSIMPSLPRKPRRSGVPAGSGAGRSVRIDE